MTIQRDNGTETIHPTTKRYASVAAVVVEKLQRQVSTGERNREANEKLPGDACQQVMDFCSFLRGAKVEGDYQKDAAKEAEEMAAQVMNFVNTMSWDKKAFIDAMLRQHRTLHQNFMELVLAWLIRCAQAYEHYAYDARNEASCKLAHKMVSEFLDGGIDDLIDAVNNNRRLLPFI